MIFDPQSYLNPYTSEANDLLKGSSSSQDEQPSYVSAFIPRISGVSVDTDKWGTLARLKPYHDDIIADLGFRRDELWLCEQVHGAEVVAVEDELSKNHAPYMVLGADGLVASGRSRCLLGIYVADCAAVWLWDRRTGAMGLVHSGKKGTEGEISVRAVALMTRHYGTNPADVVALISPCIRPPYYEVDIAPLIVDQLIRHGVEKPHIHDCGICTGEHQDIYYTYRREKGATGRMLALFGRS